MPSLMVSRRRRSTAHKLVQWNHRRDICSSLTFFVVVFALLMPLLRANSRLVVIRCRLASGSHERLGRRSDGVETSWR